MFDDDGLVGKCPEDAENPAAADSVDGLVEPPFKVNAGMVMSWSVAPPEFPVDSHDAILKQSEAFPVRFLKG